MGQNRISNLLAMLIGCKCASLSIPRGGLGFIVPIWPKKVFFLCVCKFSCFRQKRLNIGHIWRETGLDGKCPDLFCQIVCIKLLFSKPITLVLDWAIFLRVPKKSPNYTNCVFLTYFEVFPNFDNPQKGQIIILVKSYLIQLPNSLWKPESH